MINARLDIFLYERPCTKSRAAANRSTDNTTTVDFRNVQLPRQCLWLCAWSCTFVCRMCLLHDAFSSSAVRSSKRISALSIVVCDYARVDC